MSEKKPLSLVGVSVYVSLPDLMSPNNKAEQRVLGWSCFCSCHNLSAPPSHPPPPQRLSCLYLRRAEKQRMYSVIQRSSAAIS